MKITVNKLDLSSLKREESLFHTANGYLGVRGCFEEGYPEGTIGIRGCYINGFYDVIGLSYPEKLFGFPETAQRMVNLPDTQTTRLFIDGEEFSAFTGSILGYERILDMESGTVSRIVHWCSPKGKELRLCFERMVSFVRKELFLTKITIEGIGCSGNLEVTGECICDVYNFFDESDPRVASERVRHIHPAGVEVRGETAAAYCKTSKSNLEVAAAMGFSFNRKADVKAKETENGFKITAALDYGNEPAIIEKYCVYSDSLRGSDLKTRVTRELEKAMSEKGENLFAEQKAYLDEFWNNCGVKIHGGGAINEGMAYNLYGLLQSAGRDEIGNIAAKGLSGEGYEGHYFWDTEIYMLPLFMLTRPEHAKKLLGYRHSILDKAREHARILGHKNGVLYSWRTITGSECSSYFPSGSAQYHINGDVAHAFLQYFLITKDISFMAEKGAEVLVETARLWLDAGQYDRKGRLCFNGITGPDEYTCIVNNNYFTNMSAKHNLLGAAYICDMLKQAGLYENVSERLGISENELESFRKAAADIYIPYDEKLDINPQDDSFLDKAKWDIKGTPNDKFPLLMNYHPLYLYRHQVCKQADTILSYFLYEEPSESVMRNSYNYYEEITTHDSTLSAGVFSIMASRLDMPEKAYDYFLKTVRTDLDDSHGNTGDGIHAANMGGAYLAVVAGFAGLRVREDGLHIRFTLPKEWTGYEFSVRYAGSLLHVYVKADGAELTLKSGSSVPVFADGAAYTVSDTLLLDRNLK